jgi:hypothetical protein
MGAHFRNFKPGNELYAPTPFSFQWLKLVPGRYKKPVSWQRDIKKPSQKA